MEKVSIILPVYNAERFISKTIESILVQSFKDWELIIIDDCSKDQSLAVCEQFAEKDKRIKIIASETNQGSAETRNKGLELATGTYIAFVDSDDYIEKDYLLKLYTTATKFKADVVWCDYNEISDEERSERHHGLPCLTPLDTKFIISCFFQGIDGITSPCNKLYTHKIISNYSIRFDKRMAIGEDAFFNLQFFDKAQRTVVIDDCLYNYVHQNKTSVMSTYKPDYYSLYKIRHSFLLYLAEKHGVAYDYQKSAQGLFITAVNFLWLLAKQEHDKPFLRMKKVLHDSLFQLSFNQLDIFKLKYPYNFIFILLKLHLSKIVFLILRNK